MPFSIVRRRSRRPPIRRSTRATGVVTGAGANHYFSKEGAVQQRIGVI
jgi:hypothetical protein